jgi:hypothetical protein
MSREYGILNFSQFCRLSQPVMGIALHFFYSTASIFNPVDGGISL